MTLLDWGSSIILSEVHAPILSCAHPKWNLGGKLHLEWRNTVDAALQQLPSVPADTNGLLKELERLAEKICSANNSPNECRAPVLVIHGK